MSPLSTSDKIYRERQFLLVNFAAAATEFPGDSIYCDIGFLEVTSMFYSTDYGDTLPTINERCFTEPYKAHELFMNTHAVVVTDTQA